MYVKPVHVTDARKCDFYHTIELPGHGLIQAEWDLRGREPSYLGKVELKGKTVLEMGTANGYLAYYMERQGAQVTAYDLSDKNEWDVVPYASKNYRKYIRDRQKLLGRLGNGFWLAHGLYHSKVKLVHGTVYALPKSIGQFDIGTFGSILLHLRDPFLALQTASPHIKETLIVTDLLKDYSPEESRLVTRYGDRLLRFLPDAAAGEPMETWWSLSPQLVLEFLRILGFGDTELSYHSQLWHGREIEMFTAVGRRRKGLAPAVPASQAQAPASKVIEPQETSAGAPPAATGAETAALDGLTVVKILKYLLHRVPRALGRRLFGTRGTA